MEKGITRLISLKSIMPLSKRTRSTLTGKGFEGAGVVFCGFDLIFSAVASSAFTVSGLETGWALKAEAKLLDLSLAMAILIPGSRMRTSLILRRSGFSPKSMPLTASDFQDSKR